MSWGPTVVIKMIISNTCRPKTILDDTQQQGPELTRDISFQIPPPQHTDKISQVYHLTEEIKCRNDSFIAPSKLLSAEEEGVWK